MPQTHSDNHVLDLEARLASTRSQLRDLATMGAVITSIHEIDAVLSVVMDMSIRLVDGEVGLIMLEEDQGLHLKTSWGLTEEFARSLDYYHNTDLPTYVFENRQAVILNELNITNEVGLNINSLVCLPIKTSTECFGILMIVNKHEGGTFTDDDSEILDMLANFAAVAIQNSILIKARLAQKEQEQELALARQIQKTILPQRIDDIAGVEIGAEYFPMGEVGGDFYDVIPLDEHRFVLVLGDVSSHGMPAALVMAAAAGMLKAVLKSDPQQSMAELAGRLNNLLANEIIKDKDMFITLFVCRFDLESKQIEFCNAGHLPGLFWDSSLDQVIPLTEGGPIIGQFAETPFKLGSLAFGSGDRLFLFTDGLTEAADADGNLFGRERVQQIFAANKGLSPSAFCSCIKELGDRFSRGSHKDTRDDFTILQLTVK
ncbi:MAG: PP2C family protein-serine/threonine phosphatase [bacterium]